MNYIKVPKLNTLKFRKKSLEDINEKIKYWKKYLETYNKKLDEEDKENINARINQYSNLKRRVERLINIDKKQVNDFYKKNKIPLKA